MEKLAELTELELEAHLQDLRLQVVCGVAADLTARLALNQLELELCRRRFGLTKMMLEAGHGTRLAPLRRLWPPQESGSSGDFIVTWGRMAVALFGQPAAGFQPQHAGCLWDGLPGAEPSIRSLTAMTVHPPCSRALASRDSLDVRFAAPEGASPRCGPTRSLSPVPYEFADAMHGWADARGLMDALECQVMRRTRSLRELNTRLRLEVESRRQTECQLIQDKVLAHVTLAAIDEAVMITDGGGRVTYFNPAAERLTQQASAQVRDLAIGDVLALVDGQTRGAMDNPVCQCLREGCKVRFPANAVLVRADGGRVALEGSVSPVYDAQGKLARTVTVLRDVTEARRATQQLSYQATHDPLTGLFNRRAFELRMDRVLESARSQGSEHALCYMDLDHFKLVNDSCGHAAGDELLRQLSDALQVRMRRRDTLARLGGDEFGALLELCPMDQAMRIANELREAVEGFRFLYEDNTYTVGVSIGLVPITPKTADVGTLLRAADAACYIAKNRGRNRIHVYAPADGGMVRGRREVQWVNRLTTALEENRLCLYYQPVVGLRPEDSGCRRYEVALRLREPDGSVVPPGAFLPAAQRYNLMRAIDRWVVRTALENHGLLAAHGQGGRIADHCSIKVSGDTFQDPSFALFVEEQLSHFGIPAHALCFHVPESMVLARMDQARSFVAELKNLGCGVGLEHFGSGLGAFRMVKELPLDYIKIDGSLIREIRSDHLGRALVSAMNDLGHTLNLRTIADWTEDDSLLYQLRELSVDYAQGFAVGRPQPLDVLLAQS